MVRTRAPLASKLLFSSTQTMNPRVESATASGAQVGFGSVGLSLKQMATKACRFTASVWRHQYTVTKSFAAAVTAPLR